MTEPVLFAVVALCCFFRGPRKPVSECTPAAAPDTAERNNAPPERQQTKTRPGEGKSLFLLSLGGVGGGALFLLLSKNAIGKVKHAELLKAIEKPLRF